MKSINKNLFRLIIQHKTKVAVIDNYNSTLPFYSVGFDIEKNPANKLATATFSIYNWKEELRMYFAKNEFEAKDINIAFYLGNSTTSDLTEKFSGKVKSCRRKDNYSDPTIETEIEAYSVNDNFTCFSINAKKNTPIRALKAQFAKALGLMLVNNAGDDTDLLKENYSCYTNEPLSEALSFFKTQNIVIDGSKMIFNKKSSAELSLSSLSTLYNGKLINDDSGVIKTPERQGIFTDIQLLLMPSVGINDYVYVDLANTGYKNYNGAYQVYAEKHTGRIAYIGRQEVCVSSFSLLGL